MTATDILFTVLAVPAALLLFDRFAPLTAGRLGLALEQRLSGLRLRQGSAEGFAMPYLEGGSGAPLVLIHGFAGDKDNFTRIARYLTPHYRVIIPDLPGFGDAGRDPRASYLMADQARRLAALLDQVAPGPVHIGGNSMGGFIAGQFAAMYPERAASLWLLDAAGTEASHSSDILKHYDATGEMPLLVKKEEDFHALIAACTDKEPFLPHSVRVLLGRRGAADFALHTALLKQMKEAPLLQPQPAYAAIPALIVWGEQDRILHPDGAAAFAALFPNSRTIMMPGVGHLPMVEKPRETASDYLAFRRSISAA
ncbi:alpha/beta fold hydrolase [Pseudoduganella ginsengisoli]|uniref:Alpha/beta fold hydrolase n=1 Tax=Pseudoduganella ginsengisoli TaxID=1462440 RepID=A0A6L6Q6N6_9BURK|nr:alpha/beta hydrolase [Pseudoduganella ginsengisoli]MTW05104.1 alpha/beta fold hydrolase [Pseudoduganella ginsengisoli]